MFGYYGFWAWLSRQNNLYGGKWFVFMMLVGTITIWTLVSRVSKNLMRDGLLYDSLMLLAQNSMWIFLGLAANFGIKAWIGVTLMVIGFFLIR